MLAPMPLWRPNRQMVPRRFSDSGRRPFPRRLTESLQGRTGIPTILPDPRTKTRFSWRRRAWIIGSRGHIMRAMILASPGAGAVQPPERPSPMPSTTELLVRVAACGVCRTDLHIVDGELPAIPTPIVPGHEIVGVVERVGDGVAELAVGDRVGIPWLGYSCGRRGDCVHGCENVCVAGRCQG